MSRPASRFAFAPQPLLARDKVRMSASRSRWSSRRRAPRRSTRPNLLRSTYRSPARRRSPLPPRVPRARRCCRRRSRQYLHGLAAPAMRRRWRPRSPPRRIVVALPLDNHRIVTNPMEPRGADRQLRRGARTATRCTSPARTFTAIATLAARCAWRAAGGGAVRRAGCRRRLRREEFCLRRARADAVGGEARRPAGQVDRQRSEVFLADHQARDHAGGGGAGARCRGNVSWRCASASIANLGAYMAGGAGGVQTNQYVHLPGTVYRHPGDRTARAVRC